VTYNQTASASSDPTSPNPQPITNALISRLVDPNNKVVGIIQITNHLSKGRYDSGDEATLASLLPPLTAVALTVERSRALEGRIMATETKAAKLERASDSKWLLSGVVDEILTKVNAITNSKKTKLWLVDQRTETFSLYDSSPETSQVTTKQVTAPIGTGEEEGMHCTTKSKSNQP
jgi:hypothetical protein